jgi:hypothetical protein
MLLVNRDSIVDVSSTEDNYLHIVIFTNQKQKAKLNIDFLSQNISEKQTIDLQKGLNRIPIKVNKKRSTDLYQLSVDLTDKKLIYKVVMP